MTEVALDQAVLELEWEALGETGSAAGAGLVTERAQVFGGWLVRTRTAAGQLSMTFVADGQFRWDGEDFGDEDYEEEEDEDAEEDEEEGEEDEEEA
ncbi:DNA primase [Lysobacter sp. S4-A87]|uniref:DNA primase n=1 Tax=Lysobacter sp. S4-A87 TaxID=2925843 RepID=UPI001F53D979|nr:DNA primase [Lysobacter sp. S4-A87]UNK49008.1 DNA primase [Lysobacter sp. S4-A87]